MKKLRYKIRIKDDDTESIVPLSIETEDAKLEVNLAVIKSQDYVGDIIIEDIPMTAEEARAQRDKLLEDTDWTQVLDAPIDADTREAYRAYRQALRDIPEQEGFPHSITWPEPPVKVKAAPDPVDDTVDLLLSGATGEEATA